ncbi:MAG: YebF family protein [Acinetobacter sp.]
MYIKQKLPSCSVMTNQQLETIVTNDLRKNRIPRWADLSVDSLGTQHPEIKFPESSFNNSANQKLMLIAVDIVGVNKTVSHYAIYDCEDGHVEYSGRTLS